MEEKHKKILDEVLDEIEAALKDLRGTVAHQRRLAFALSLGAITLIESYLSEKEILKKGFQINHGWFKKKKENVKNLISKSLISPIENLENIDSILDKIFILESERNEIAYGKSVSEEKLKEKINLFFELKKEIEDEPKN